MGGLHLPNFTAHLLALCIGSAKYRHLHHLKDFSCLILLLSPAANAASSKPSLPLPRAPGRGDHGNPQAMAERRVDQLIKMINGTPEQKTKLLALAQTAMTDMKPLREQLQAARKRGMELLSAASIDRGAIDKLRGESVQLMDGISRRMSAHMMDAAEVLTPAQRAQVAEKMKSRGDGRGEGRGGWGGHHGGAWLR
jgi:Spy/CpxP family protein refolding chaperone